jgi:hypothetical protein
MLKRRNEKADTSAENVLLCLGDEKLFLDVGTYPESCAVEF